MKFNNGDEIFTKKLIRSIAKEVGLPARHKGRKRIKLTRLVKLSVFILAVGDTVGKINQHWN